MSNVQLSDSVKQLESAVRRLIAHKHPTLVDGVMSVGLWRQAEKGIWWASQLMRGRTISRYGRSHTFTLGEYAAILLWMRRQAEASGYPLGWVEPGFKVKLERAFGRLGDVD